MSLLSAVEGLPEERGLAERHRAAGRAESDEEEDGRGDRDTERPGGALREGLAAGEADALLPQALPHLGEPRAERVAQFEEADLGGGRPGGEKSVEVQRAALVGGAETPPRVEPRGGRERDPQGGQGREDERRRDERAERQEHDGHRRERDAVLQQAAEALEDRHRPVPASSRARWRRSNCSGVS